MMVIGGSITRRKVRLGKYVVSSFGERIVILFPVVNLKLVLGGVILPLTLRISNLSTPDSPTGSYTTVRGRKCVSG